MILTLFVFQIPSTSMKYFDKMCLLPRNLIANYLKHIWKSSLKTLVRARSAAGQVALKILKLSEFELIQTVHTLTVHSVHIVQVCSCADVVCTYCAGSVSIYIHRIEQRDGLANVTI